MRHDNIFDYIVIGAGSSGCAFTAKLHELLPQSSILMIESGGNNNDPKIHNFSRVSETYSEYTWQLNTTKQKQLNDREITYLGGNVNGGSGSINGMVCVKPHPADTLMKFVSPISVNHVCEKFKPSNELTKYDLSSLIFDDMVKKMSFIDIGDYIKRNDSEEGLAYSMINVTNTGYRRDPYSLFVRDDIEMSNKVYIINKCVVGKLIFEKGLDHKLKVIGVETSKVGKYVKFNVNFYARHEVILNAGTVNTPTILLKSGIGPQTILSHCNIPQLHELPVGENLHDQLITFSVRKLKKTVTFDDTKGNMCISGFFCFDNFEFSPTFKFKSVDTKRRPEFQLQIFIIKNGWGKEIPPNSLVVGIINLHPKSRGSLKLNLNNGVHQTLLDPQYICEGDDLEKLIDSQKIANAIIDNISDHIFEGPRISPPQKNPTRTELIEYIRNTATTDSHPAGTCSIGKVVNNEFEVLGIEGLRISDASVIPNPVSGNPQVAACAVGEEVANSIFSKLIKNDSQAKLIEENGLFSSKPLKKEGMQKDEAVVVNPPFHYVRVNN